MTDGSNGSKELSLIRDMARTQYSSEGQVEIDSNAEISMSEDNGAYVQAWVWVSFAGTSLDYYCPGCDKLHIACDCAEEDKFYIDTLGVIE